MNGLLIDPIARTVTPVEVPRESWRGIVAVLGCDYMDVVNLTSSESLYIDDEGRYQYPHPNGYFAINGNVFCGRGLVLGLGRDGESGDTRFTAEQIAYAVEWCETPAQEDIEPSFTVVAFDAE